MPRGSRKPIGSSWNGCSTMPPAASTSEDDKISASHAMLVKWADLETSGRLARLNETQMQGDFLAQVFGEALAYAGPLDGKPARLEFRAALQHRRNARCRPRPFSQDHPRSPLAVVELKGPDIHLDRHRTAGQPPSTNAGIIWSTSPDLPLGHRLEHLSFRLYDEIPPNAPTNTSLFNRLRRPHAFQPVLPSPIAKA